MTDRSGRHDTSSRYATLRYATPRHATLRQATPRHATLRHATPRLATLRQATPQTASDCNNHEGEAASWEGGVNKQDAALPPVRKLVEAKNTFYFLPTAKEKKSAGILGTFQEERFYFLFLT